MIRLALLALTGCEAVFPLQARDPGDGSVPTSASFVQSNSSSSLGATELPLTFSQPIEDQDLIVVAIGTYENDLIQVADSSGNTYEEANPFVQTLMAGRLHIRFARAAAADTLTVTVTGAGASPPSEPQLSAAIHAYRGVAPRTMVSKSSQTGETDPPVTSVTLGADNALMFVTMTHDVDVITGETGDAQPGEGFSQRERPNDNPNVFVPLITADRFGVPAGPTDATFGLGADVSWAMQLVAFE